MLDLLKNPAVQVTVGALVVFGIGALLFPPAILVEIISTLVVIVCVLGLIRWGPTGLRVYLKGAKRTEDWGILAISFMLFSIVALRIYGIVFRQLDRPLWLQESYWSSFFVYLTFCAVVLFFAATKDEQR